MAKSAPQINTVIRTPGRRLESAPLFKVWVTPPRGGELQMQLKTLDDAVVFGRMNAGNAPFTIQCPDGSWRHVPAVSAAKISSAF